MTTEELKKQFQEQNLYGYTADEEPHIYHKWLELYLIQLLNKRERNGKSAMVTVSRPFSRSRSISTGLKK